MRPFKTILVLLLVLVSARGARAVAESHDPYWHLTRGYELFNSKPYQNGKHGMTDSVQEHYDVFLDNADKYGQNYTLGLFLISEFYHDIEAYDKEVDILDKFLNTSLPEKYTLEQLHLGDPEPFNYFVKGVENIVSVKLLQGDAYHAMKYTKMLEGKKLEEFLKRRSRSLAGIRAALQADVYSKQGHTDAAIKVMMPHCLEVWDQNSLDYSMKLLEKLKAKYKMRKIQAEVDLAFRELYQKDVAPNEDFDETKPFYIRIFNTEVQVPGGDAYGSTSTYDDCFYTLQTSEFYMIVNLTSN